MSVYLAESKVTDVEFSHAYDAKSEDEAIAIAQEMGYDYVGRYMEDDEVEASIELELFQPSLH